MRSILHNKKGEFFKSEIFKVVLGIVSLILLIILASKLYGLFINKSEIEQARSTLDHLINEIKGLEEGGEGEFLLTTPAKWVINVFDDQFCICNPEKAKINFDKEDLNSDCQINGLCEKLNVKIDGVCKLHASELVGSCITIGMKSIILKKDQEIVTLIEAKLNEERNQFEEFLEFKLEENEDLISLSKQYIRNREDKELKKLLGESVRSAFNENELENGLFYIMKLNKIDEKYFKSQGIYTYSYPDSYSREFMELYFEQIKYIETYEKEDYGVVISLYEYIREEFFLL